jgi:hypothetical protein
MYHNMGPEKFFSATLCGAFSLVFGSVALIIVCDFFLLRVSYLMRIEFHCFTLVLVLVFFKFFFSHLLYSF